MFDSRKIWLGSTIVHKYVIEILFLNFFSWIMCLCRAMSHQIRLSLFHLHIRRQLSETRKKNICLLIWMGKLLNLNRLQKLFLLFTFPNTDKYYKVRGWGQFVDNPLSCPFYFLRHQDKEIITNTLPLPINNNRNNKKIAKNIIL